MALSFLHCANEDPDWNWIFWTDGPGLFLGTLKDVQHSCHDLSYMIHGSRWLFTLPFMHTCPLRSRPQILSGQPSQLAKQEHSVLCLRVANEFFWDFTEFVKTRLFFLLLPLPCPAYRLSVCCRWKIMKEKRRKERKEKQVKEIIKGNSIWDKEKSFGNLKKMLTRGK